MYQQEVAYIQRHGLSVFPYYAIKEVGHVDSGYDKTWQLPYVIHNNKKLFFPASTSIDGALKSYKNFRERECILGGGYCEKCPHSYISNTFTVHRGDVLLDIGAAEALFTLEHIDLVSKVYIFEPSQNWRRPLQATFANYKGKVVFINKLVSDIDSDTSVTLSSVLGDIKSSHLFVKMDVEGYEQIILRSSMDYLFQAKELRIACCTYHKQTDAVEIAALFEKYHLNYEFSDGYMLFKYDPMIAPPFFRHGMIRGWK